MEPSHKQVQSELIRLLEEVLRHTTSGIALLDRDFRFLRVNPAYAEATAHSPEQLVGRVVFEVFPNEELRKTFEQARTSGESARFRELPLELADRPERGVTYWDWALSPIRDESNLIGSFVLSVSEVTEHVRARGRAEEAEQARAHLAKTLAAEISHRTKNNLAMVAGLLQMRIAAQSQDSLAAEIVRQAISLLRTFSLVQDQVHATQAEVVDVSDVLHKVTDVVRDAFPGANVETVVHGDSVSYPAQVAAAICVVANELVTNAIKHGSPGSSGKVTIKLILSLQEGSLRLSVWNSGNPVPPDLDISQQKSMGLRLIHDIIVGRYRGSFALRPHEGGTLAEIAIDDQRLREV